MTISPDDRLRAEIQCEAFITVLCRRYGIAEEDIPELIAGLRWASEHRAHIEKVTFAMTVTLLAAVVSGFILALWEGFKHFVKGNGA